MGRGGVEMGLVDVGADRWRSNEIPYGTNMEPNVIKSGCGE